MKKKIFFIFAERIKKIYTHTLENHQKQHEQE